MTNGAPRAAVLLLTRPDCHLCEEFRAGLQAAFPDRFDVREACVDDRADWQRRYGLKVPVLLSDDGAVLCATHFDAGQVASGLGLARP